MLSFEVASVYTNEGRKLEKQILAMYKKKSFGLKIFLYLIDFETVKIKNEFEDDVTSS